MQAISYLKGKLKKILKAMTMFLKAQIVVRQQQGKKS